MTSVAGEYFSSLLMYNSAKNGIRHSPIIELTMLFSFEIGG